jgi:hypothetical protein|tara:strand:- start:159 stop:746 length:588 start_codon:yes stop_codon:yes gene_type:complete
MQKMVKGLIALVLIILVLCIEQSIADTTSSGATDLNQTNTSGTNTSISGGYSSETTYQSGSSSNTTNTTNNSSNTKTAVNPSNAPAMSVYGQDSCVIPLAAGITVIGFSGTYGSYYTDPACELRKKSKLLNKLGMKVAAISLMCQDDAVFDAMMNAGTPCPVDGLIGEQAKARWLEKRKEDLSNETSKRSMTWND